MKSNYEITILKAVFLLFIYFIIGLLIPAFLEVMIWESYYGENSVWLNLATLIIFNIIFFLGLTKATQYKVIIFQYISGKNAFLAVSCALFFYLALDCFLDPIFDNLFPSSAIEYREMLEELRQVPLAAFIRICLFAPITEELIMRGYIFTGLQNKYGKIIAVFVSAILFGVLHFNFVQTLSAMIAGLILCLLYMKTKSLFFCILAHSLYNAISFFAIIM